MTTDPIPLTPERQALVEHAARSLIDRPHTNTPIPDLIIEYELTVAEACAAVRRAQQMRICRKAFT